MTRRACLFSLAVALASPQLVAAAPSLTPVDQSAFRNLVANHKGRILLVDFWATWCAPCREEMPKFIALAARYNQQVDLVTISCDEPEAAAQAAAFLEQNHAPIPRYIRQAKDDDAFINAIDPKWSGALPALFVFDRHGRQVNSFVGETNTAQVEGAIRKLVGG